MGHQRDYSEEVASIVDEEVRKLIDAAHDEAWHVINDNRDILDKLVLDLLERETLDKAEVAEVFEPLRRRSVRPAWTGSPDRVPSTIPPIDVPRSASNGTAQPESESAVILTPPGAGGDVHGDPGVTGTPGTSPQPPGPSSP
jgi:cell division protease FtsH